MLAMEPLQEAIYLLRGPCIELSPGATYEGHMLGQCAIYWCHILGQGPYARQGGHSWGHLLGKGSFLLLKVLFGKKKILLVAI